MRKRYICRCSDGHLFTHSFWWQFYGGAFNYGAFFVMRGFAGYTHCPVGSHWAHVRLAKESELTAEERETLKARERLDDRDGVVLTASIGLFLGVVSLVGPLVNHSRWELLPSGVWIAAWVALFIRAVRVLRSS